MRNDRNLNESLQQNNANNIFYGDGRQNNVNSNAQFRAMPIVQQQQPYNNGMNGHGHIHQGHQMVAPRVNIIQTSRVPNPNWQSHQIIQPHPQIQHIQRTPLQHVQPSSRQPNENMIDYTKTHLNSSAFDD